MNILFWLISPIAIILYFFYSCLMFFAILKAGDFICELLDKKEINNE